MNSEPAPLPRGFGIEFDSGTKQLDQSTLFGGSPARVMRLSAAGRKALAELREGTVGSAAAGVLARKLTDAGLAHPRPPELGSVAGTTAEVDPADVTVIIPVRDRAQLLDRCLEALGRQHPVVVADDGSADPGAVAQVAARHGASLRRRPASGGPAAARNTGLAGVATSFVAFVDSDCVPPPGWIQRLAAHFADPLVGAVAPRIVAPEAGTAAPLRGLRPSGPGVTPGCAVSPWAAPRGWFGGSSPRAARRGFGGSSPGAAQYAAACGSLDLGGEQARVVPASRVSYVPTAALVVRRAALEAVTGPDGPFDPALRYGEDVDLVWKLHEAGWRIRYQPDVRVRHDGPASWPGLLAQRFRYGTSAAPLARRHPKNLAPLVLHPWPAATVAALLTRRPVAALAGYAAGWFALTSTLRRAGVPADGTPGACATAVWQTWRGVGRFATQFAAPVLAAVLVAPGGRSAARRWGRRAAAASLLIGPAVVDWRERKPPLDPVRFVLGRVADDVSYGAGVWAGCLAERTAVPVRPVISWRPLRIAGAATGDRPQSQKGTG